MTTPTMKSRAITRKLWLVAICTAGGMSEKQVAVSLQENIDTIRDRKARLRQIIRRNGLDAGGRGNYSVGLQISLSKLLTGKQLRRAGSAC